MSTINQEWLKRSLNFHGQQLSEFLRHNPDEVEAHRQDVDYHVYHKRAPGLPLQERGQRRLLHKFIANGAGGLFAQADRPASGSKSADIFPIRSPLECYSPQPHLEARVELFFREALSGVPMYARVAFVNPSGLLLNFLGFHPAVKNRRFIADMKMKSICPVNETVGEDLATARAFQPDDVVCVTILEANSEKRRVLVSMKEEGLAPKYLDQVRLGLADPGDAPSEGPSPMTDLDAELRASLQFINPSSVQVMAENMGLSHHGSSLMPSLRAPIPEDQTAPVLRRRQNAQWAFNHVASGIRHFKAGQNIEAFQCLNQALKIDSINVEALVARGALYANNGSLERAIQDFDEALTINPHHKNALKYISETLVALGRSLEEANDLLKALAAYEKITRFVPDHKEARESVIYLSAKMREVTANLDMSPEEPNLTLPATLGLVGTSSRARRRAKSKKRRSNRRRSNSESSNSSPSSASNSGSSPHSAPGTRRSRKRSRKHRKRSKKDSSPTPLDQKHNPIQLGPVHSSRLQVSPPREHLKVRPPEIAPIAELAFQGAHMALGVLPNFSVPPPSIVPTTSSALGYGRVVKEDDEYERRVQEFLAKTTVGTRQGDFSRRRRSRSRDSQPRRRDRSRRKESRRDHSEERSRRDHSEARSRRDHFLSRSRGDHSEERLRQRRRRRSSGSNRDVPAEIKEEIKIKAQSLLNQLDDSDDPAEKQKRRSSDQKIEGSRREPKDRSGKSKKSQRSPDSVAPTSEEKRRPRMASPSVKAVFDIESDGEVKTVKQRTQAAKTGPVVLWKPTGSDRVATDIQLKLDRANLAIGARHERTDGKTKKPESRRNHEGEGQSTRNRRGGEEFENNAVRNLYERKTKGSGNKRSRQSKQTSPPKSPSRSRRSRESPRADSLSNIRSQTLDIQRERELIELEKAELMARRQYGMEPLPSPVPVEANNPLREVDMRYSPQTIVDHGRRTRLRLRSVSTGSDEQRGRQLRSKSRSGSRTRNRSRSRKRRDNRSNSRSNSRGRSRGRRPSSRSASPPSLRRRGDPLNIDHVMSSVSSAVIDRPDVPKEIIPGTSTFEEIEDFLNQAKKDRKQRLSQSFHIPKL
eukprot:maker-scaffold1691_size31027-snap-gene-0.7 protein:Tk07756 transcript:maker-scaffold1691_size31027-snap-gene-0.7-mRNA-1 annotation:"tetratricopeptide repeat protein 14-like protein"